MLTGEVNNKSSVSGFVTKIAKKNSVTSKGSSCSRQSLHDMQKKG